MSCQRQWKSRQKLQVRMIYVGIIRRQAEENKPKPAKTSCLFHATVFQNHQETGTGKKTKSCPGIL